MAQVGFDANDDDDKENVDMISWFVLENEGVKNFEHENPGTRHFPLSTNFNGNVNVEGKVSLVNNDIYPVIPVCCEYCKCYGHLSRDCPRITPADGARRRICANCCSHEHTDHNQCPYKLCPVCLESGHSHNECPKRHQLKSQCYRCSNMGHEKAFCPENWRRFFLTVNGEPVNYDDYVRAKRECCSNCGGEGHSYGNCRIDDLNETLCSPNTTLKSHERRPPKGFHSNTGPVYHPHNNNAVKRGNNNNANPAGAYNRNMNRGSQNVRGSTDTRRRKYSSNSNTGNNKPGLLDMNNNTTPTNDGSRTRVFPNMTPSSSSPAGLPIINGPYNNSGGPVGLGNPLKLVYDFFQQKSNDCPHENASLVGQINALRNPIRLVYPGYQPPMSSWSVPISVTNSAAVTSTMPSESSERMGVSSPSVVVVSASSMNAAPSSGSASTNAASSNLSNSAIAAAAPVRLFVPSTLESTNVSNCTISCSSSETQPQSDSATVNASSLFH